MKTLDLSGSSEARPDRALLAVALSELARPGLGAVSLPWFDAARLASLRRSAARLPFRTARQQVGDKERVVFQDFEITLAVPKLSRLRALAEELTADLAAALSELHAPPITPPPLNEIAVQRYAVGSRGISAHRDHLRYRDLIVLLTLSGSARLFLCDDRSGGGAEEVSIAPGRLVLMRAPGYAGSDERPFHRLGDVSARRYGIGLRHDSTKEGSGP